MMRISLLLLVLVSILTLNSVEARKLSSTNINGGTTMKFTVDLIHRNSLLSPEDYQKRQPSRGSHRAYKNNNLAATENKDVVHADVGLGGGDYLVHLAIGTPPFEFVATADTGSDLIWLQCAQCQQCIDQGQLPFFDPTNSSTYQLLSCGSQVCLNSEVTTQCGSLGTATSTNSSTGVCLYDVAYGDQTESQGILSSDTLTFPDSSTTLSTTVFGCGLAQSGSLSNGEGIVGLGAGPFSLPSQLGSNINYKFSYCLVPRSSPGTTSKLRFGADLISTSSVSIPYVTLSETPDYYVLSLDRISVGSSDVSVGQNNIIVDSGTTLTMLDQSTYSAVLDAVNASIGMSSVPGPYGMDLCYVAAFDSLNPPDVVLHFGGKDVVLKKENVFWNRGNETCLAIVSAGNGIPILGNIGQSNFEVGYDMQNKLVSFAPTDCTKY